MHPSNSTTTTAAIRYDLSMALYALQKALCRLPPEKQVPPDFTFNLTDLDMDDPMHTTTLHQDLRAAIFSTGLLLDRVALEGIQEPPQQAPHASDVCIVGSGNAAITSRSPHRDATPKQERGSQQTPQSSTSTAQPAPPSSPCPPTHAEYAALPAADVSVSRHLWDQLAPFILSEAQQTLWQRATRKLAELRTRAKQKGAWSEHVVQETARWRCWKVWRAVREELLETGRCAAREDQERLEAVTNVLVSLGDKA